MLRLTVETETGHKVELRVTRNVYKNFSVAIAGHWKKVVTPFVELKTFADETAADDYALALKAAILGLSVGEVEP